MKCEVCGEELFAGEPYFTVELTQIKGSADLHSDAATCTLECLTAAVAERLVNLKRLVAGR